MSPASQIATNSAYVPAENVTALTQQHVGLVHHVARQLARRLHDKVDVDELVSAGALGLMQAAASYEPARGLTFSTYAVPRIRGSMLDELRRHDHMSRGARRKARAIMAAREALVHRLGREPRTSEVAVELSVTVDTLRQWELDVDGAVQVSLDVAPRALRDEGHATAAGAIADESVPTVDDRLAQEERIAQLGLAIRGLRAQERTVLALYFHEELTLQEIARVLALSASRISQIRGEALAKLRTHLGAQMD
ncbi:MAG TPA: FliA/WhiG family RNA polymerase sigma factor [Gemmatimonadaceae bacterium]|nr:FliA/WhiG family RNA polymerase sigma factor [Gemmatimonadaceae bacterium]